MFDLLAKGSHPVHRRAASGRSAFPPARAGVVFELGDVCILKRDPVDRALRSTP